MKRLVAATTSMTLVCAIAHDARADVGGETSTAMHSYFDGERNSGWLWGGVGLTAVGAGAVLATRQSELARGVAYPMLAIGGIQTLAGVILLATTNGRIRDNDAKLAANPSAFHDDELARIKRTNTTFLVLEIVEAVLVATGTTLAIVAHGKGSDRWTGVGIGLAVQGATMFALDALASHRGHRYQEALERVTVSVAPGALQQGGGTFVLSGSF